MRSKTIHATALVLTLAFVLLILVGADWRVMQSHASDQPGADPQATSLRRLQTASRSRVAVSFAEGFPRSVSAHVLATGSNSVERATNYLRQFSDLYAQSSPHLALKVKQVSRPPLEGVLFQQTYRGLEVFGAQLLVSLNQRGLILVRREVFQTTGALLTSRINLDPAANLFEEEALRLARNHVGRPEAQITVPTRLVVFDRNLLDPTVRSQPHLAWLVTLEQGDTRQIFIDAHNGQVLMALPSGYETGAPLHGLDLDMQDAEDEGDSHDGPPYCFWSSDDVDVADEDDFNNDYDNDPEAVQGFNHIRGAYSYFHESFNRHSYDDDFSQLEFFIHATTPGGARWESECELIEVHTGYISFDVVVHEFTHAVISDTSQLVYNLQSGALNESYADVMGVIADQQRHEALGEGTDFTLGEDRTSGLGPIRSIEDPAQFAGQPSHMINFKYLPAGEVPDSEDNDWGYVHTNSGIPNKAAHLMIVGSVNNIFQSGRNKTRNLKWTAATRLPKNASFLDARNYEVAVAEEWRDDFTYGFTLQDVCAVRNSWAAVGVGYPDTDCDGQDNPIDVDTDGDFIPDTQDNCDFVANPSQGNSDFDQIGNACDTDDDNDGIPDTDDECPFIHNPPGAQCNDLDDDGVIDTQDNCEEYNPNQKDSNGDGEGDACEADLDGDGVDADEFDNCPVVSNPDQANADGDGFGDICDKCPNTPDPINAFGFNGQPFQPDSDGDGIPDTCDSSLLYDGRTVSPGTIKPDSRIHDLAVDVPARFLLRVPISICPRDCPTRYDDNDLVELLLTGLDENVKVWVTDDEGEKVSKAIGPDNRRQLHFRPKGGRNYFLSFAFRPGLATRQLALQMQMSAHGF